jgi:broad specificity phosphatase PhoE
VATRLLLIRHGETASNVAGRLCGSTDSPLSAVGELQARHLARFLAETERIDALYSSPLQRARHTAEAIGERTGLTPVCLDDLRELDCGDCEDLTLDEIQRRFPDAWERNLLDDEAFGWPGGETRAAFYARTRHVFGEIADRHPLATVLVVSHGAVLSAYLAALLEGRPSAWPRYLLDNCSVSEVQIEGEIARLVRCNVRDFLNATC